MSARRIMKPPTLSLIEKERSVSALPDTPFSELAELMFQSKAHHILVTTPESQEILGQIMLNDLIEGSNSCDNRTVS